MPLIVLVSGSPAPGSRSLAIAAHLGAELSARGFAIESVDVRDLPPADLLGACLDAPAIRDAVGRLARADGVVLITPVYKAAYSGALKAFLDLLPQSGLAGKVVLPVAVGGTLTHFLAIDYALRPVLASMGCPHVIGGLFFLDSWLPRTGTGAVLMDQEEARGRLAGGVERLVTGLRHEAPGAALPVLAAAACTNLAATALTQ